MDGATYHVSRALYRRLAPLIRVRGSDDSRAQCQRVLDACEQTMRRIEREPHFARPERFLFELLRPYFSISDQVLVRKLIDFHIPIARQLAEQLREYEARTCAAFTRQGQQCQRTPVEGSEFCPSHRHLELLEEAARLGG